MMQVLPASPDEALRRCALTLHALGPVDRDWLLSKLPGAASKKLQELLAELSMLAIPKDLSLVRAALRAPTAPGGDSLHEDLAAWPPAALAALLDKEPPMLAMRVLQQLAAAQRAGVMSHVRAGKREEISLLLQQPELRAAPGEGSRLRGALLAELAARSGAKA